MNTEKSQTQGYLENIQAQSRKRLEEILAAYKETAEEIKQWNRDNCFADESLFVDRR